MSVKIIFLMAACCYPDERTNKKKKAIHVPANDGFMVEY